MVALRKLWTAMAGLKSSLARLLSKSTVTTHRSWTRREFLPRLRRSGIRNSPGGTLKPVQLQKDWCERRQLESGDHGLFPPCHWCGEPTSNWCEHCHVVDPAVPKTCICADCDDAIGVRRLCRLSLQVQRDKDTPSLRQTPDSCRMQQWACAQCGERAPKLKLCSGCKCARYCSVRCQRAHHSEHKELCAFLGRK